MIEWLGTSHYSFLEATASPGDLLREAHRLGYQGLGLGDRMGQHGLVQGHQEFLNLRSEGKDFFLPQASGSISKLTPNLCLFTPYIRALTKGFADFYLCGLFSLYPLKPLKKKAYLF